MIKVWFFFLMAVSHVLAVVILVDRDVTRLGSSSQEKSVVVNIFESSKQTHIFFFPPHRQTWDQAEGCDLLPGNRRGLLRSPPQCHKGTLWLSSENNFFSSVYFHLTFSFISNMLLHSVLCFFSPRLFFCFGRLLSQKGFFSLNMTSVCIHALISPHWTLRVQTLQTVCSDREQKSCWSMVRTSI